jgi:hypothetical protein
MMCSGTVVLLVSAASNSPGPSALELASRTHRNIFLGYMCWLAVAAVATLFFTWALWKSSNRRQDAAKAEAELRALKLEEAASHSEFALQKVELALATAREKQARAEESLRKVLFPRLLDSDSFSILNNGPRGSAEIWYLDNDPEAYSLAQQMTAIGNTRWIVSDPKPTTVDKVPRVGVRLEVGLNLNKRVRAEGEPYLEEPANTLWEFLKANQESIGTQTRDFVINSELPHDAIVIVIGAKP